MARAPGTSHGGVMRQLHTQLGMFLCTLWLAGAAVAAEPDPALTDCGERSAQAVQKHYSNVTDLAAEFVQTTRAVGPRSAQAPTAASGKVVLQVPGKMRWTYEKPDPSLVVSDGKTLWLYDPAFGEAQKLPVTDSGYLSGAAIQFLLGRGDLAEEFEILPIACDAGNAELKLTPKAAATYEYLVIWVDPGQGRIIRTEVVDLLGNRTRVEFHDMKINQKPDASVFRFEPPKGVSVVEIAPTS